MHEMTHVWQYQLNYPIKKAGLTVSSRGTEAYEYTLARGRALSSYNMEQQGEIISDYYIICLLGDALSVWNMANSDKSPTLLISTLQNFLNDPADRTNLPF